MLTTKLDVAYAAAAHVGVAIDDATAHELAPLLELRLREVLRVAIRFAQRARRGRRLLGVDVTDAMEGFGDLEVAIARHTGAKDKSRNSWTALLSRKPRSLDVVSLGALAAQELPSLPHQFRLHVEWLAVAGSSVHGCDWRGPREAQAAVKRRKISVGRNDRAELPMTGQATSLPPLIEEQNALLIKIAAILEAEDAMDRHMPNLLAFASEPRLAQLRPHLACLVSRQVAMRVVAATPKELHALLAVLEALAFAVDDISYYMEQCLSSAFLLCLSPDLGLEAAQTCGSGEQESLRQFHVPSYLGVRRRAAAIISKIVASYADDIPELPSEVGAHFEKALSRKPTASTASGAILGISMLGPLCVEEVLIPVLRKGLLISNVVGDSNVGHKERAELFEVLVVAARVAAGSDRIVLPCCSESESSIPVCVHTSTRQLSTWETILSCASALVDGSDCTPLNASFLRSRLPSPPPRPPPQPPAVASMVAACVKRTAARSGGISNWLLDAQRSTQYLLPCV